MRRFSYAFLVLRSHRGFTAFSLVAAGVLQFLIIKAITGVDTASLLPTILSQLPERFRMVVNETLINRMGVAGAVAFGFSHPIVMVLIAINSVSIPARHISGEIEDGAMEVLLSHPVSRARVLLTLWGTTSFVNLLVVCGALIGSLAGIVVFHGTSGSLVLHLLQIGLNLWILSLVIQTVAVLASAYGTRGSRPALWTAVVVLTFYVLFFLTPLWDVLEPTAPFNIFTYYQPQKLMFGGRSFGQNVLVLGALTALCLATAVHRFNKRDIP